MKRTLRMIGGAFPRDPGRRVVVLCYHSVHPSLPFSSATPQLFSEHLAWLRENCRCVPFSQVLAAREGPRTNQPVVSVTFDDGYDDNHEFALPLLVKNGIHATFFITTGLIERDHHTLERFRALRNVDREMIRPLQRSQVHAMLVAGMDIGAHTFSHPNLARLTSVELADEVADPMRVIEDRIGRAVSVMAYPFGRPRVHVSAHVVEAVREAGYDFAATTVTRGLRPRRPSAGHSQIHHEAGSRAHSAGEDPWSLGLDRDRSRTRAADDRQDRFSGRFPLLTSPVPRGASAQSYTDAVGNLGAALTVAAFTPPVGELPAVCKPFAGISQPGAAQDKRRSSTGVPRPLRIEGQES